MSKRFRVKNYRDEIVFKADTTQEIYEFLERQDLGLNSYLIECLVDDIEIDADEFLEAFRDGECPGDLQFF